MHMTNDKKIFIRKIEIDDEIIAMYFDEKSQAIIYYGYKTEKSGSSLIEAISPVNKYKCLELFYKTSGMSISGPNGDKFIAFCNLFDSNDVLFYNKNTFQIASSIIEAIPVQDRIAYYG